MPNIRRLTEGPGGVRVAGEAMGDKPTPSNDLEQALDEVGITDDVTRRRLLAAFGGAAAGGFALAAADPAAAGGGARFGADRTDRRSVEFIGQTNQAGTSLTTFGWLTHLEGVADSQLFTGPPARSFFDPRAANESLARFTFFSVTTLRSASRIAHHLSVKATGGLAVYFQPNGGARLTDPNSFARGTRISSFSGRFQNRLVIFDGGQFEGQWAITSLSGDLIQRTARSLSVGGRRRTFGRRGLRWSLDAGGEGHLDDPSVPRSHINFMGSMAVQDAAPVR